MNNYFNINFEFNHSIFKDRIKELILNKEKGYICVVDANVLTIAQHDIKYRDILNSSTINTCDGSSIALLAGLIHKKKFRALNGPEIFLSYIEKDYNQLLLGSSENISKCIKDKLQSRNINNTHLSVMPLPFLNVDEFDYEAIANCINEIKPDIIWVSLGAPKQERFMFNLLPFIDSGVMFGIGAAFSFYIGDLSLPKFRIGALKFIWVNRLINEPKKLISRLSNYLIILPKLILQEIKKNKLLDKISSL